jgi:hypothetical protein
VIPLAALAGALLFVGCGGKDFANEPRPAVTLQLSGVITADKMVVQPSQIGAGPVVLLISNQTDSSHSVTLDGDDVEPEEVGPINPLDTATIQKDLPEGDYQVTVVPNEDGIKPAELKVTSERPSGSNTLLLP